MKTCKNIMPDWRYRIIVLFVIFLLLFVSCAQHKLLKEFKQHHKDGEFAWIANQTFECNDNAEICRQFHLIKGDACYNMAKTTDSLEYYDCAVYHLENGITMTSQWQNENERDQNYKNLCESLRNVQDLQKGEDSRATLKKFVEWSQKYLEIAGQEYEPVFFYAKAKLRSLEPWLLDVDDSNRASFCDSLQNIMSLVRHTIERGETEPEKWNVHKAYFKELSTDLELMKKAAGCNFDQ